MLIRQIRRSFTDSGATYGVRRVWPDLLAWGYDVGRERVARLMRQEALKTRPPKRKQAPGSWRAACPSIGTQQTRPRL